MPGWIRLGDVRTKRGALDAAHECYAQAVAVAPNDPRAAFMFISADAQRGTSDDLRRRVAKLAQAHPEIGQVHELLAQMRIAMQDPAGAEKERRLAAMAPWGIPTQDEWIDGLTQFSFYPDFLRIRADKAASEHRFDAAENLLKRALQIAPADPDLLEKICPVYEKMGRAQEAIEVMRQGVAACPDNPGVRQEYARLLCSQRRVEEAVAMLRAALQRWPEHAGLHMALGIALSSAGRKEEAVPVLREAVRLDSTLVEARYDLSACLLAVGQRAETRTNAEATLVMRPDYPNALLLLGSVALDDGDLGVAEPSITRLFALRPADPRAQVLYAELHRRKGAELERTEKFAEAEEQYVAGLQALPNYTPLLRSTRLLAMRQHHDKEAIDAFGGCVVAQPGNDESYLLLGQALLNAGRSEDSRKVLQEGLQLAEKNGASERVREFKRLLER
ncbi:MAG TPA: tetratricopeptide repeat protein [Verrucomicrobiae bacterium]|nr:tetratricopeptide repeat protein [Verrucomicrobiae bacterium]